MKLIPRFFPARLPRPNAALLLTGLTLALPRSGRAEDALSYKYEDYRESGGRIAVQTQSAHLEKDIGTDAKVKIDGVIDAIAGATPNGQPAPAGSDQVVLSRMTERRKAWNAEFSRQFSRVNIAVGGASRAAVVVVVVVVTASTAAAGRPGRGDAWFNPLWAFVARLLLGSVWALRQTGR